MSMYTMLIKNSVKVIVYSLMFRLLMAEYNWLFSGQMKSVVKVNLMFPDVALDQFGNKGFWTMIYNQVSDTRM